MNTAGAINTINIEGLNKLVRTQRYVNARIPGKAHVRTDHRLM